MGIDIMSYRIRIGRFNINKKKMKEDKWNMVNSSKGVITILIIAILLIIGGVELNPGPNRGGQNTDGLEIITVRN